MVDMQQGQNTQKLQKLRSVIESTLNSGEIIAQSDQSRNEISPIAINRAQGEMLRDWVIKEQPESTIEVGFAWGISTLYICEGHLTNGGERSHIALDPFQTTRFKSCGLKLLGDAEISNMVQYFEEESQLALPRFVEEGRQFDFAFVDGSHLFDRVFLDLIYLGRLLRPGGVIFADDYQGQAVEKAVSFCLTNLGWTMEEIGPAEEESQWAVLRTARETRPRGFPHFVEF